MNFYKLAGLLVLFGLPVTAGCHPTFARYPAGQPILLLDGPTHLGNNKATGQNFPLGEAGAARVCSLVNFPEPAKAYLEVQNVRNTESLGDVVTINNEKPLPLPITLEQDPHGQSPNSTSQSPVELISLPSGPSEICLVAGVVRPSGDLDDFEVDQMVLYVQTVDASAVQVRRSLQLGRPARVSTPGVAWGRDQ